MNAGKSMGSYTTGGSLQQFLAQSQGGSASAGSSSVGAPTASASSSGVDSNGPFSWSQTSDDVEVCTLLHLFSNCNCL
jgi:hypothetical protein